jgi:hypothetical protein
LGDFRVGKIPLAVKLESRSCAFSASLSSIAYCVYKCSVSDSFDIKNKGPQGGRKNIPRYRSRPFSGSSWARLG